MLAGLRVGVLAQQQQEGEGHEKVQQRARKGSDAARLGDELLRLGERLHGVDRAGPLLPAHHHL